MYSHCSYRINVSTYVEWLIPKREQRIFIPTYNGTVADGRIEKNIDDVISKLPAILSWKQHAAVTVKITMVLKHVHTNVITKVVRVVTLHSIT
jgi:hypothetical protein